MDISVIADIHSNYIALEHAEVLQRAMELCRRETGVCNWPNIPEKYWEEALNDFLPNK